MAGMILKQLGSVRGARKRLGGEEIIPPRILISADLGFFRTCYVKLSATHTCKAYTLRL